MLHIFYLKLSFLVILMLLVKNDLFDEIPFSKMNSIFWWWFCFHGGVYRHCKKFRNPAWWKAILDFAVFCLFIYHQLSLPVLTTCAILIKHKNRDVQPIMGLYSHEWLTHQPCPCYSYIFVIRYQTNSSDWVTKLQLNIRKCSIRE